jgi:hypothetical protein
MAPSGSFFIAILDENVGTVDIAVGMNRRWKKGINAIHLGDMRWNTLRGDLHDLLVAKSLDAELF